MIIYILRRFAQSLFTLFGVITAAFFLVRLSGDPVALLLPIEATPADIERMRIELGLDRSLPTQYGKFLLNVLRGDFGSSLQQHIPAFQLVLERLPATLELAAAAFMFGVALAFIFGLTIHLTESKLLREIVLWIAFLRQAIPVFWFGLLLILIFSVTLKLLPSLGRDNWRHLILPALTLGTYEMALYLRLFNAAMAQEKRCDYVRTALSKGQSRAKIIVKHMMPNALLPLVTVAGVNLGVLLGGAVVTETVFSWPGVGRLIVQSVSQRDYPVVIAGLVVVSFTFILVNMLVDMIYAALDPRIRLS